MNIRSLFGFRSREFTDAEQLALSALKGALPFEAARILTHQLLKLNSIERRSGAGFEALLYYNDKDRDNPDFTFPNRTLEISLARVTLLNRLNNKKIKFEFTLVRGHLFTIHTSIHRDSIPKVDALSVSSVKLLVDPLEACEPDEPPVTEPMEKSALIGWLRTWKYCIRVADLSCPYSADLIDKYCGRMETTLPIDYLELIRVCNGFTVRSVSVVGIGDAYLTTIGPNQYWLLASSDNQALLIRHQSSNGMLYIAPYSSDLPFEAGLSFQIALEKMIE